MSRKSKSKQGPPKPKPRRQWRHKGKVAKIVAVLLVAAAGAGGLGVMRSNLLASAAYAGRPARVALTGRTSYLPSDIPAGVLAEIQAAVAGRSVFDEALARDVYQAAAASPWVHRVQRVVKGHDGAIVIHADFRRPFALVATKRARGERYVVDAEGVVLPLQADRVRPGAFILIDGVVPEPPEPGKSWNAPDLADGLRLYKLIKGRPYEHQLTTIDVRNHNGRKWPYEPHLRMYAQLGRGRRTAILFGRFPFADGLDYCLPPEDKLAKLDAYVAGHGGRLAGEKEWIDLQHDQVYHSLE